MSENLDNKLDEANKKAAEGREELRKKQYQKDLEDYALEVQKRRQMDMANWRKELFEERHIAGADKEGNKTITLWEKVLGHYKNYSLEQASYQDWRSAMMALLNMFTDLVKAGNVSMEQTIGEYYDEYVCKRHNDPIGKLWGATKAGIYRALHGHGSVDLPVLQNKVSFQNGKVEVADLTRKDGVTLEQSNQLNEAFKLYVDVWLGENGYIPAPNEPGRYVHHLNQNEYLDEAKFDQLKQDPTVGLATFLKNHADETYEEAMSEAPAMRR